jgi:hypothetical protein
MPAGPVRSRAPRADARSGPDVSMPASSRRKTFPPMTVTKKPITGESTKETVKTTVCGNAGCSRCTCGGYTRVPPTFYTRGCGCSGHPAFPAPSLEGRPAPSLEGRAAPSVFRAKGSGKTSGASRRGALTRVCGGGAWRKAAFACDGTRLASEHLRCHSKVITRAAGVSWNLPL